MLLFGDLFLIIAELSGVVVEELSKVTEEVGCFVPVAFAEELVDSISSFWRSSSHIWVLIADELEKRFQCESLDIPKVKA